jgi:hypothetical protein
VSPLEEHWDVELELPLGLTDEARRPGTKRGMARWGADHAVDRIPRSLRIGMLSDTDRWRWALPRLHDVRRIRLLTGHRTIEAMHHFDTVPIRTDKFRELAES